MLKLPIAAALFFSAAAGLALAGVAMPPHTPYAAEGAVISVANCGDTISKPLENGTSSRQVRRSANCNDYPVRKRREIRRDTYDCHRDVRTHRVGGIRLKHRHVGANCAIREVTTSN